MLKENYQNINDNLLEKLDTNLTSPITGIINIQKILETYGVNLPLLYELDKEGGEFVLEIDGDGNVLNIQNENVDNHYLYVVYLKEDDGSYIMHSEITDRLGIEEILKEDDANLEDV